MFHIKRLSIVHRLALIVLLVNVVVFSIITGFVYQRTSSQILEQTETDIAHELDVITTTFEVFDSTITQSTRSLGNVFFSMFPDGVRLDAGNTQRVGNYDAPVLSYRGEPINMNFTQVDEFTRITGGNATVFVRYQDDFLRISTSLKKQNGERATGTLLGKQHPGYRQLMQGKVYMGKARLFGRDYMTEYKPVVGANGMVIAVLYVGFDFTEIFANLRNALQAVKIGASGFVFLANAEAGDERGRLLIHPHTAGGNLQDELDSEGKQVFTNIFDNKHGKINYTPSAKSGLQDERLVVFRAIENWNLIIGISAVTAEMTALSGRLSAELTLFTSLMAALIVGLLYFFVRQVLAPLTPISRLLARVGDGDLSAAVQTEAELSASAGQVKTRNEITLLQGSVATMIEQFRELVAGINEITGSLNQSAASLSGAAEQTHQDLTQQQARTDQVATSVTEMSASIQEVAGNVNLTATSSREANDQVNEGESSVTDVEHSIKNMAEQVEQAADVITNLKLETESIGSVLDVIREIAEQTNLLALNAAIEAARAGEQGRGFAVVADEVRGLAQRTQNSIQEIQQMIDRLQSKAGAAVAHMETSRDHGRVSVGKATSAATALHAIKQAVAQISDTITQVASTAEEQSAVAEEINGNVVEIRDLSEGSANRASETANMSEDLVGLARKLQENVGRFSL